MRLADVVGQERAIALLRESIARGRLHHALLFSGPQGVGKRTTALALAAYLLCERPAAADSCGVCAACAQVDAGTHPDLHVEMLGGRWQSAPAEDEESAEPKKRRKGRRASARPPKRILIEQLREIQAGLASAALGRAGRKIAVVDEAHSMRDDAQNAFLKTLEEPPGNALIVLVAANASALLPTVRSRCQHVVFAPLDEATIERRLRDLGRSPAEARDLAAWADGSLAAALAADPSALRGEEERLRRILDGWQGRSHREVLAAAEAIGPGEGSPGLPLLLRLLRSGLRAAAGLGGGAELTRGGKTVSLGAALEATQHAYRASADLRKNANPSIAIERMWLRIGEALRRAV